MLQIMTHGRKGKIMNLIMIWCGLFIAMMIMYMLGLCHGRSVHAKILNPAEIIDPDHNIRFMFITSPATRDNIRKLQQQSEKSLADVLTYSLATYKACQDALMRGDTIWLHRPDGTQIQLNLDTRKTCDS